MSGQTYESDYDFNKDLYETRELLRGEALKRQGGPGQQEGVTAEFSTYTVSSQFDPSTTATMDGVRPSLSLNATGIALLALMLANSVLFPPVTCYSSAFQTVQTLALVSLAKDSSASDTKSTDSAIFIVPDAAQLTKDQGLDRIYKDLYGIDAAELAGKEVVKIDGMDPWT